MPANVTALLLVAPQGQELACALEHAFWVNGILQKHGVLSYYAALALGQADTVDGWRQRILALCAADKDLPAEKRLSLTTKGATNLKLPGATVR